MPRKTASVAIIERHRDAQHVLNCLVLATAPLGRQVPVHSLVACKAYVLAYQQGVVTARLWRGNSNALCTLLIASHNGTAFLCFDLKVTNKLFQSDVLRELSCGPFRAHGGIRARKSVITIRHNLLQSCEVFAVVASLDGRTMSSDR